MRPHQSPMVASWELVLRLRERRYQVGVEVRKIAQELNFSRNYWSAVENERKILSEESLTKVLELLDFEEEERQELLELREVAKKRGWWAQYSGLLDREIQRFYGLESGAQSIRTYESLLIPGLLQTPDYARAIMLPEVTIRQVEVDQRVEIRLRRQERLKDANPLHLTAIISEAALRQQIGGPDVLRRQLKHLTEVIEEHPDTVEIRVVPFTATACGLFGAATVHLIEFENTRLPTLAWQETVTTWGIIDVPAHVRDISTSYNESLRRTLNKQDSLKVIRQFHKELS